ncbi:PREDICTED: ADP-ribosylation factor-like protein 10 [Nanorana parkeri]|uniref:ADP-ribosylation factor-like protein 10 n=1 Tax=Nanorana parkeri TaxID=125878 RepID=UPI000853F36B|nr:PREDICTED: ADP-ribosylation factor-like protein 10 [Nanorana parkeri]
MAAFRNLSMVIGAAVAALGSVLVIAWSRYMPGRRKYRRTGYQLEYSPLSSQPNYLDRQILVLGLDGAGKSSIIHALSTNSTRSSSAPTHGFNTAHILSQGLRIELLEVGGSQNLRTYWNQYLKNAHIIVFVVDSTDDKRLQLARQELHRLLEEASQLPLMVLANKQDRQSALDISAVHSELSLHRIQDQREVTLLGTSAVCDGFGQSTSLQTVRSLLEERLLQVTGSQQDLIHLQNSCWQTSFEREKSA